MAVYDLHRKSETVLDPTDANKCADLSHKAIDLLHYLARALQADDDGMRMGRDTNRELSVRAMKIAAVIGLLPYNYRGEDVTQLWKDLGRAAEEGKFSTENKP